mgnify:FL=1
MSFRTDLALETRELLGTNIPGIKHNERMEGNIKITNIEILNDSASQSLKKPKGKYVTIEFPTLTDNFQHSDKRIEIVSKEIASLIPNKGLVLVVGVGNTDITPDALGPKATSYILATRHIKGELARSTGLDKLRPVSAIFPGVLGQTGIETSEFITSIVNKLKPSCVIIIDALASKQAKHLGCTIQISNTGITPGSGVGNSRPQINKDTLNVPVISIGVPTVVDASTLAYSLINEDKAPENLNEIISPHGSDMMVTPREIDLLIERASKLIGLSINCALQKDFSAEDIYLLVC